MMRLLLNLRVRLNRLFCRHSWKLEAITMSGRQVDGPSVIPAGATVKIGVVFEHPVREERCQFCGKSRTIPSHDSATWDKIRRWSTGSL